MLRASVLVFLAIAVFGSLGAFVGRPKPQHHDRLHLILGADKCTRGPGYWCQNISTAHECGTAQHCVTKQWNTMELPADHSEPCDLCVKFLSKLESVLRANLTVDVIEGVIDNICTSVMIPAKVCEKYLDPYIVEIQYAIVNHIKPQVTCNLIHFCNNDEGVGKTYERLANTMAVSTESKEKLASVVDAFKPLGPGIMITGNSEAVYGGVSSAVAPLSCTDGQVYWCKSLENAKECNQIEHCKKVVWAHQEKSPLPDISSPHADSTATPPTTPSPLNFARFPSTSPLCAQGQSFWCSNLTSAASCGATQHCIQSVWTHLRVKQDNDDVCTVCKDMVKEARDQLTSNETQNDLKAVFEGSCNLIPVKIIREGCDKLADDFVPELIEVLSSQMNPDVVCSVAGLCNNAAIDKLLLTTTTSTTTRKVVTDDNSDCKNCVGFADLITKKFNRASKQEVTNAFHGFCTEFSSFSDACLKVVDSQGDQWYNGLKTYFNDGMVLSRELPFSVLNICRVNKMCTNQTIPSLPAISVEVSHKSESGVLSREEQAIASAGSDLPCSLCGQLVNHLKDILVANTTETEFKQVLEGICKQTGAFSTECTGLVEQYYEPLYLFLTSELDSKAICVDVGLCPKQKKLVFNNMDILNNMDSLTIPMHFEPVQTSHLPAHVSSLEDSSEDIHMNGHPVSPQRMIESTTKPACLVCEYILHFVQEQVADMKNSEKILAAMHEACGQMPGEFATECEQFVTEYGKAFIALAIQQIDPSQVCPKLRVCSTTAKAPLMFGSSAESSQGTCPLCLLAVQAIDEKILNNRTEDNIKHTLDTICNSLPKHLSSDCTRFINVYYDELIDMIVAETTPQEICVYMRLCLPPKQLPTTAVASSTADKGDSQACILCEFVMTKLDKILKDRKTDEQIKHAVHSVCHLMPKTVRQECDDFVNKYSDLIIQLLAQSLSPHDICEALGVCKSGDNPAPAPKPVTPVGECAICEDAMSHLDDALADPNVEDNNIKTALDKVCYHVGKTEFDECNKFILKYGTKILTIVDQTPSYLICNKIKVCPSPKGRLIEFENEHLLESASSEKSSFEMDCNTTLWGYKLCQKQVPLILIGMLMLISLIVIFVTARTVRRNRLMTRHSGVMHTPYEKLYQPTTIPTHGADDFTSTIVR